MGGLPALRYRLLLALIAGALQGSVVLTCAQPSQGDSHEVEVVRRVYPDTFRESAKDRLSGGLPQRVPFRLTTDSRGRILVTDPFLSLVQVLDIEGEMRWQLKGDRNQQTVFPTYIAVDGDDNIYVSEPKLAVVLVFFPDGRYLRSIGETHLFLPFGLALDKENHRLYVADHHRDEIQVYSLEGKFLKTIGSKGAAPGQLYSPTDVALHDGLLYVLDSGNARFQSFDLEGHSKAILPFGNDHFPLAFSIDPSGNFFCVDQLSLGLLILDSAGNPLSSFAVRRPYGQPGPANPYPTYTSVAPRPDGAVLALRPDLTIDILRLKLVTASSPAAKGE
jgi:DNA-binding beta-propeller fold protein YncE